MGHSKLTLTEANSGEKTMTEKSRSVDDAGILRRVDEGSENPHIHFSFIPDFRTEADAHSATAPETQSAYNGPKNSDTKDGLNKVVKCHHAKTIF